MEIFENTLGLQFFIPLLSAVVVKGLLNVTFAASGLNLLILPCSLIWTRSSFPGYTASCVPSKWAFKQINLRHFIKSTLMQKPPPELNNYLLSAPGSWERFSLSSECIMFSHLWRCVLKTGRKMENYYMVYNNLKKFLAEDWIFLFVELAFAGEVWGELKIFFSKQIGAPN